MTAYLTATEAASYLRMSSRVLREKAAAGLIPGSKEGRWRFTQADLDEYVARGANTTTATPQRRRRRRAA